LGIEIKREKNMSILCEGMLGRYVGEVCWGGMLGRGGGVIIVVFRRLQ